MTIRETVTDVDGNEIGPAVRRKTERMENVLDIALRFYMSKINLAGIGTFDPPRVAEPVARGSRSPFSPPFGIKSRLKRSDCACKTIGFFEKSKPGSLFSY